MRILVVEDEKMLAGTLADILSRERYLVDTVYDGEAGLDGILSGIYDGVILDVMLPKMSGIDVLRKARQEGVSTPVMLLTARSELEDRVKGLDSGADYYLTKPFAREELLACLRAIIRRPGEVVSSTLRFGDLELAEESGALLCSGRSVQLGAKELQLMRLLMASGETAVPKETLYLRGWGYDGEAEANVVEVYMSFLRRKLSHLKSDVKIVAVRGVGYHLKEEQE